MTRKRSTSPSDDSTYDPPRQRMERDANLMLLGALCGLSTSDMADAMDREAHADLQVNEDVRLPIRGSTGTDYDEAWAAMGVVFGENVDDLFRKATLPKGWSIKPTDHPMHSDLLDQRGRRRAGIFYKSAFWDRDAHMYPEPRFRIERDFDLRRDDGSARESIRYRVRDGRRTIFETEIQIFKTKEYQRTREEIIARQEILDAHEAACRKWLLERYPNFEKIAAHWDEP